MAICSRCKKIRYKTPCENCGYDGDFQELAKEGGTGGAQPPN